MKTALVWLLICGIGCALFAAFVIHRRPEPVSTRRAAPAAIPRVPRKAPDRFPPGTHLPDCPEIEASGPINLESFSPEHDLVRMDNQEIWWESDHDGENSEDDHLMHRAVEPVLARLAQVVTARGATLKVHDAYRPHGGGHCATSLHKEGRAIDVTAEGLPLEELAKLCWMAEFDWVFNENMPNAAHIHCSLRASGNAE